MFGLFKKKSSETKKEDVIIEDLKGENNVLARELGTLRSNKIKRVRAKIRLIQEKSKLKELMEELEEYEPEEEYEEEEDMFNPNDQIQQLLLKAITGGNSNSMNKPNHIDPIQYETIPSSDSLSNIQKLSSILDNVPPEKFQDLLGKLEKFL